ncbi:hypothetical protein F511_16726 [Dorcoceras hygrometricum]|uniref:Uncharacterized protein n=1 Tax=Dorcoceras hygrometricum TaxID=472368 RepID=A0A2Z7B984_9LAMI|nr:hypothetical protein F511_16726 [Dorcoceras hygrometricum]
MAGNVDKVADVVKERGRDALVNPPKKKRDQSRDRDPVPCWEDIFGEIATKVESSAWLRPDSQGILALQRLAAVDLLIRSTTGNMVPSSSCNRRPLTNLARTKSLRKGDRNKSDHAINGGGGREVVREKGPAPFWS